MISRHHYPTPPADDLARIAAQLDAEDAENGAWPPAEWWAKHAAEFNDTPPRLYVSGSGMAEPPTVDAPLVITGQGDYRREVREDEAGGMFTAAVMVALAMIGALGLLGLGLWAGGAM